MKQRQYPQTMTPRSPEWLALMADLELGCDQPEPYEVPRVVHYEFRASSLLRAIDMEDAQW